MKDSCENCKFLIDLTCRRYPPSVSVVLVPQKAPMNVALKGQQMVMAPTPVGAFPPIQQPADLWCGEHKPAVRLVS